MKIRFLCIILILLFNINMVYAENTTVSFTGASQTQITGIGGYSTSGVSNYQYIWFKNPEQSSKGSFKYLTIAMPHAEVYPTITKSSEWSSVTYKYGTTIVGTGQIGYNYNGNTVYIMAVFNDDFDISAYSGTTKITISDSSWNFYFSDGSGKRVTRALSELNIANSACFGNYEYIDAVWKGLALKSGRTYTLYSSYKENYYYNYSLNTILNRYELNLMNPSAWQKKYTVNNGFIDIINESSLNTEILDEVYSIDLDNYTWNVYIENAYGDTYSTDISFISLDTTPNLYTNKTVYNDTEHILITYENLFDIDDNCISYGCSKPYEIAIVYYDIDSNDYNIIYSEYLSAIDNNGEIILPASLLTPYQDFNVVLTSTFEGYPNNINDWLLNYEFSVNTIDEYITTSCVSPNCYTYNGNNIIIYYNINNNSIIYIYDDENNLIQSWYNIIGEGYKSYNIPSDANKLYTYPDWNIYINNTGYTTNYSTPLKIYYSDFATPTPTPTPQTPEPINESIDEQIQTLKDESKPIFDLIYGLSEIVVDNPDYDDSGIVDEYEINNWLHSLIPISIVLSIFIFYLGLKYRNYRE